MSNTEIQEGNKLIAEFMGLEPFENPYRNIEKKDGYYLRTNPDKTVDVVGTLKYHSSWDWLMPVVEKINTIAIDEHGEMGVYIKPFICYIGDDEANPIIMATKGNHPELIEMIWTAVLTFVKWYNQNKKP